jgi:TPR repeat protein
MSEATPKHSAEGSLADLQATVLREVSPVFRGSTSPCIPEDDVKAGVSLLFELLAHRIGDLELDAIGDEVIAGLDRWFNAGELVKLVDRYEPFCKFLLQIIDSRRLAQLEAEAGNRLSAAKVIKALGLVTNKAFSAFESCDWKQFPPADVIGKPHFLEHIARTYIFRNVDDHKASVRSHRENAQIAESFCVFLVWSVIKFNEQIAVALMTARFSDYLQMLRRKFATVARNYVELTTEARLLEEFRFLDPLSVSPEAEVSSDNIVASKLSEKSRVAVIEAEPGAGKTTTLQFLAWKQADALFSGKATSSHIPVYVELKLLSHHRQTLETAVDHTIKSANRGAGAPPWDSLLLLVDGVNEVSQQLQTQFKAELRDLLSRFPKLQLVLAGRPNSFHGEFDALTVVLQRLTDKQLAELFSTALEDNDKAAMLLVSVQQSRLLRAWARTPLHAAMVAGVAKQDGIDALTSHSTTVRRFLRGFLKREVAQVPGQTRLLTKERLLARLALETKSSGQLAFDKVSALSILAKASAQIGATRLDLPKFIQEVIENHLLQEADDEAMKFSHELYHDYFAASELETRERIKPGAGVEFALAHFREVHWSECIRLFAGAAKSHSILIKRGAEKSPFLAWHLLRDAGDEAPDLVECITDEAYCALSAALESAGQATIAGACILVLADLGRTDLLEQAISKQGLVFEPKDLWKLTEEQEKDAREKQKQVVVPLANGLLLLIRSGIMEQQANREDRFCQAARSAIRGLERIRAARALLALLSIQSGSSTFEESALVPGAVLKALMNLGPEAVLDEEDALLNKSFAEWLRRASEAGVSEAWRVYGRLLRLVRDLEIAEMGLTFDGEAALKWLRKSHEAGDKKGSLELALLLVEAPDLSQEAGEGERMLSQLAQVDDDARYELGLRVLKGDGLLKNEAEGFEHLLSAAESGHVASLMEVQKLIPGWFVPGGQPQVALPVWVKPHWNRLKVLFPEWFGHPRV